MATVLGPDVRGRHRNERPVPAVAKAVHSETHAAASARDRFLARRLAGDKPFEEPVTFDPVSV